MGRIVVTEFMSLDGVVEDPGGAEDYKYGGWSFEYSRGDDGDKFKLDETMDSEALLLGRVTYEGFADAWPSREGEFADKFNNMPKYVVSTTLSDPEWANSTVIAGDLAEHPRIEASEFAAHDACAHPRRGAVAAGVRVGVAVSFGTERPERRRDARARREHVRPRCERL